MTIHVYHPYRQPDGENFCQAVNGHCSHLCLPAPKVTERSPRISCACPTGLKLMDDGLMCVEDGKFELINWSHNFWLNAVGSHDGEVKVFPSSIIDSLLSDCIHVFCYTEKELFQLNFFFVLKQRFFVQQTLQTKLLCYFLFSNNFFFNLILFSDHQSIANLIDFTFYVWLTSITFTRQRIVNYKLVSSNFYDDLEQNH